MKLYTKLLLSYSVLFVVLMVSVSLFQYGREKEFRREQLNTRLVSPVFPKRFCRMHAFGPLPIRFFGSKSAREKDLIATIVIHLDPHTLNMQVSRLGKGVGGDRSVESIVGLRRHEDLAVADIRNQHGVIPISASVSVLDHVPGLHPLARNDRGIRPDATVGQRKSLCPRKKIVQKFHPAPGRRAFLKGNVIPPKIGRVVHHTAPRKNALGNKIGAVAADARVIVEKRIAVQCPAPRVFHRALSYIRFCDKHSFSF